VALTSTPLRGSGAGQTLAAAAAGVFRGNGAAEVDESAQPSSPEGSPEDTLVGEEEEVVEEEGGACVHAPPITGPLAPEPVPSGQLPARATVATMLTLEFRCSSACRWPFSPDLSRQVTRPRLRSNDCQTRTSQKAFDRDSRLSCTRFDMIHEDVFEGSRAFWNPNVTQIKSA